MKVPENSPFNNELTSNKLFIKMKDRINEKERLIEKVVKKETGATATQPPLKSRQRKLKRNSKESEKKLNFSIRELPKVPLLL